jgi:hypothetical protein
MFELNFRDERYLPFEGAGAISTWQLELTCYALFSHRIFGQIGVAGFFGV